MLVQFLELLAADRCSLWAEPAAAPSDRPSEGIQARLTDADLSASIGDTRADHDRSQPGDLGFHPNPGQLSGPGTARGPSRSAISLRPRSRAGRRFRRRVQGPAQRRVYKPVYDAQQEALEDHLPGL